MDLKKRLDSVIQKDKANNPKYLINLIKSDFYYLINNYFEADFEGIDLKINVKNDIYEISVSCKADRIKLMKALPN